ncbi:glycosyltransferase family 4 protein [Microbacterium sp. JC 701]|uniref:glycosyltransferase family 4 protein n=1 Tax=Microbacterium sp. JC 701 TaxID=2897389 RepID=UPI001E37076A|nr:glycosyltransferase family 4 protein [Microbacterium sp. JC 701]MCD2170210.1 glycosyltransferase family 4 protein [Microbacterium sp. JC 701]
MSGGLVDVFFSSSRDVESWEKRFEGGEAPDRWPYGLNRLFDGRVRYEQLQPLSRAQTFSGLLARKRPSVGAGIAWDENVGYRMALSEPREYMASGIVWATDELASRSSPLELAVKRHALRKMDAVWCLSSAQVAPIQSWLNMEGERVHFVPFGVDTSFWSGVEENSEPCIFSVGGDRDRDTETLFRALALIREAMPSVRLRVQTSSTLEPPEGVEVVRYLTHVELRSAYSQSSLVMVATRPNLHVSGMTVSLESGAMRRPVVITGSPGMADYVEDGVTGLITKQGDAAQLAAGALSLLRDPARRAEMGLRARERVTRAHSSVRMADRITQLVGG